MNALVIIPALIHKFTFSAPLAWLFGHHHEQVKGIYSFELTPDIVRQYDCFIVELSWFIELYEFGLIIRFIRRHNPGAWILFGGMHSQLCYRDIFKTYEVDYFIRGDNELPLALFLDGADPKTIPNMTGRNFENEQTWCFRQEDFRTMEFNLDWFPQYAKRWAEYPEPDSDVETKFDELPLLPRYWEKQTGSTPLEYRWRVPPKGGRYHLPMLVTGRGACPVAHEGCEYCMASQTELMRDLYKRPSLVMDTTTLIMLLEQIEGKFDQVTLFINSKGPFDLTGHRFNLDATIEFDTINRSADLQNILPAFKKAKVNLGIYTEGLIGTTYRDDIASLFDLEDDDHRIYFFTSPSAPDTLDVPDERRLYEGNIFPYWAEWDYYTNPRRAIRRSRMWYMATGQKNLYPPLQKIAAGIARFLFQRIIYLAGKAGLVNRRRFIT
ncbi:MAG: hypothetical protein JW863_17655 [Chitinispirillaceae bacterium]|nr:hypothetical protein [Chitinispirillaceae bacterium]